MKVFTKNIKLIFLALILLFSSLFILEFDVNWSLFELNNNILLLVQNITIGVCTSLLATLLITTINYYHEKEKCLSSISSNLFRIYFNLLFSIKVTKHLVSIISSNEILSIDNVKSINIELIEGNLKSMRSYVDDIVIDEFDTIFHKKVLSINKFLLKEFRRKSYSIYETSSGLYKMKIEMEILLTQKSTLEIKKQNINSSQPTNLSFHENNLRDIESELSVIREKIRISKDLLMVRIARFHEFQNDMLIDLDEKISIFYDSFKPKENPAKEKELTSEEVDKTFSDYIQARS